MNDLDTLKAMLLRAGYTERPGESGGAHTYVGDPDPTTERSGVGRRQFAHHAPAAAGHVYPQSIELGPGVQGYAGFAVSLFFDEDGNLVGHASWE